MQARGFTIDDQIFLWSLLLSRRGRWYPRGPGADKISRPSVFLITIDTLRADHVHCYEYGPSKTPALDKLAKEGIRFAQARTPKICGSSV